MDRNITVEFTPAQLAMLVTVLHMAGWKRKKNLPKNMRDSSNHFLDKMSKLLKKLEEAQGDD